MGLKSSNRDFLMADFETSTESWYKIDGYARVWAWGLYNVYTDEFEYGTDIASFMSRVLKIPRGKNPIIYFHNLKFDGSYIVNWLLSEGYTYDEDLSKAKTFTTCISDMGLWYFVDVCIYRKGKTSVRIRFQDSLKKIPLPVRDIPQAFGFEDLAKGDLDYNTYRPVGHQLTEEELYYLKHDCIIPVKALKILAEEGFDKMTASSDSFYQWKLTLQSDKARERHIKPERTYRGIFPILPLEVDDFVRKAYRGGWTYVNPRYANKILHDIEVWDINSMYPSKMRDKYLPVGKPVHFTGKPQPNKYQCYIVKVMMSFDIREGFLPTIQVKNSWVFNPTDYIESSKGCEIELTLTNIDLALIMKHYHVHTIKYIEGYYFRKAKGYFTKFIDTNMMIKETSTGGKRYIAKRRMNSLYGKTATSPRKKQKIPYLEDGVLKFTLHEEEAEEPQATAVGVFVTSHARHDIITDAQNNYENFVYCDTDSLHMLKRKDGKEPDIPIHQSKIGFYKKEKDVYKAIFLRSKTYIEEDYEHDVEIKCAGASPEVKKHMSFENFKVGGSYKGKLAPKQVKGGCILRETEFTIR